MGQENNSRVLFLIRLIFSLPLIFTILFVAGNWNNPPFQTSNYGSWSLYFIAIIGIIIAFFISRARVPESFGDFQTAGVYIQESRVHQDVLIIPRICPVCKTQLKLNIVEWRNQHTLLCQECRSEISVTVA